MVGSAPNRSILGAPRRILAQLQPKLAQLCPASGRPVSAGRPSKPPPRHIHCACGSRSQCGQWSRPVECLFEPAISTLGAGGGALVRAVVRSRRVVASGSARSFDEYFGTHIIAAGNLWPLFGHCLCTDPRWAPRAGLMVHPLLHPAAAPLQSAVGVSGGGSPKDVAHRSWRSSIAGAKLDQLDIPTSSGVQGSDLASRRCSACGSRSRFCKGRDIGFAAKAGQA